MKKIFLLLFITGIVQKNYCQSLKKPEVSGQSYNNCQYKTGIMDDTCIQKPDSIALTFMRGCIQAYKTFQNEIQIAHFPFNTGFTSPIMAIPCNWEREWEKAFMGVPILFR